MIDLPRFSLLIISHHSDTETLAKESCLQKSHAAEPREVESSAMGGVRHVCSFGSSASLSTKPGNSESVLLGMSLCVKGTRDGTITNGWIYLLKFPVKVLQLAEAQFVLSVAGFPCPPSASCSGKGEGLSLHIHECATAGTSLLFMKCVCFWVCVCVPPYAVNRIQELVQKMQIIGCLLFCNGAAEHVCSIGS